MVRNRLITILTINNGVLFRTRNFIPDYRYTLNFVDAWSIDEIVILDITRERNKGKGMFYSTVENFAKNCFVPICVGGKIKTISEVRKFQELGVDKILINSSFVKKEFLVKQITKILIFQKNKFLNN